MWLNDEKNEVPSESSWTVIVITASVKENEARQGSYFRKPIASLPCDTAL
jgi:hypothetical protein